MKAASRLAFAGAACLFACAIVAGAGCSKPADPQVKAEIETRAEYARRMLVAEDAGRALDVSSSPDIQFEEGFSQLSYDPPFAWRGHAFRWIGQNAHVRLRAHPGKTMRLHIQGWVNESVVRTKPQMTLFIDGTRLKHEGPIEAGHYWIDVDVPPEKLHREWVDLNMRLNAVAFHWSDPPVLMVANIYKFTWEELP